MAARVMVALSAGSTFYSLCMAWIIGDIHGCIRELEELLGRLPPHDPLVFLGDYVDRGPSAYLVVERLLPESARSVFLLGNHEAMLLAYYREPDSLEGRAWQHAPNGGVTTLRSYKLTLDDPYDSLPPAHRRFFESLELYYEGETYFAVHAGMLVEQSHPRDMDRMDLLWIRENWIRREASWTGKYVYYGHTPSKYILGPESATTPIYGKKSLGIDTGCVYGGALTAANSESGEIVQVRAKAQYWGH